MTVFRPFYDPTLEIYTDLSTNESGIINLQTGFKSVVSAVPVAIGSSFKAVQGTGFTVNHSGGDVDIYFNCSNKIMNASTPLEVWVYGVR